MIFIGLSLRAITHIIMASRFNDAFYIGVQWSVAEQGHGRLSEHSHANYHLWQFIHLLLEATDPGNLILTCYLRSTWFIGNSIHKHIVLESLTQYTRFTKTMSSKHKYYVLEWEIHKFYNFRYIFAFEYFQISSNSMWCDAINWTRDASL